MGGENNAFTSPDITNYYLTLPAANLETGFWLESDRMLNLAFSENGLEVQRKVVVEEFKQNYLNQPYGDVWLKLRPLAYQHHPYQWATIGKEVSHIEDATMEQVRDFFAKHYAPANAVLVVAGDVTVAEARRLAEKWFGPIPGGTRYERQLTRGAPPDGSPLPGNSRPTCRCRPSTRCTTCPAGARTATTRRFAVRRAGPGQVEPPLPALVKEQPLFNSLSASVMGSLEPGLLVISGKLNAGVTLEAADAAVEAVLADMRDHRSTDRGAGKGEKPGRSQHRVRRN